MPKQKLNAETIKKMAREYAEIPAETFRSIAERYGVCKTTVGTYFNKLLVKLDMKLYERVQKKKEQNIEIARNVFIKPKKEEKKKTVKKVNITAKDIQKKEVITTKKGILSRIFYNKK